MSSGNVGCFVMIVVAVIMVFLLREILTGSGGPVDLHRLNDAADVLSGP